MKADDETSEGSEFVERGGSMQRGERILRRTRVPLGFVFTAAFLVFARPSVGSLVRSLVLVVPGLLLRAYAAGYVKKNAELTTTGPYAHTRNPLYLGSLVASLGFVAASREWVLVLAFCVLFSVVYLPVIRSEERFLRGHFAGFEEYMERVPRMFPRSFGDRGAVWSGADGAFSAALYRKHREYNSGVGAVALYAALLLLLELRRHGMIPGQ